MKNCGFNFHSSYTKLPNVFFTKFSPEVSCSPSVVIVNHSLAKFLGLDFSHLSEKDLAELFSAKNLAQDAEPFCQAYAGHQFGHFTLLGDGRAHVLGEHVTDSGSRWDIQLKGSGRTPYSRGGDGKAALGPMLREYIISEAMHHLGIPTSRSLAVVKTGESILRQVESPGAILTRVASSHLRVGTFEFAAHYTEKSSCQELLDYAVQRHFPQLMVSKNKALAFLEEVMERQIELIVHWMRVGFIHGVMNTDNMAIFGHSMDYGPCAFMDSYDPSTVFSSIDHMGRYAYANQAKIAQWNLSRFAETLLPFIHENIEKAYDLAGELLHSFSERYEDRYFKMMGSKLGLLSIQEEDKELILDLLRWMKKNHADYTKTFYDLTYHEKNLSEFYKDEDFQNFYLRWQARLKQDPTSLQEARNMMKCTNPTLIARNHKVEEVLQAADHGDFKPLRSLLQVLTKPYEDKECLKTYQNLPSPSQRIYQTFCGT